MVLKDHLFIHFGNLKIVIGFKIRHSFRFSVFKFVCSSPSLFIVDCFNSLTVVRMMFVDYCVVISICLVATFPNLGWD